MPHRVKDNPPEFIIPPIEGANIERGEAVFAQLLEASIVPERALELVGSLDPATKDFVLMHFVGQHKHCHFRRRALHSGKLDLPSEFAFHERVIGRLSEQVRAGEAMLFVDVDGLHAFNTEHSHRGGDVLLRAVAKCLHDNIRTGDLLAHIQGDEYLFFVPGISRTQAVERANFLSAKVSVLEITEFPGVPVSVSIGVAHTGDCGFEYEALKHSADIAMHHAKDGRKVVLFTPGMEMPKRKRHRH